MFLLPGTLFIPRRLRHLQQIDTFVFALSGLCQHVLVYFIDILSIDTLLQVMHLFRLAKRSMRSNFQPLFFFLLTLLFIFLRVVGRTCVNQKANSALFLFPPLFFKIYFLFFEEHAGRHRYQHLQ